MPHLMHAHKSITTLQVQYYCVLCGSITFQCVRDSSAPREGKCSASPTGSAHRKILSAFNSDGVQNGIKWAVLLEDVNGTIEGAL